MFLLGREAPVRVVLPLLLAACAAHVPPIPGPLHTLAWSSRHDHDRSDAPAPPEAPKASRPIRGAPSPIGEAARYFLEHPTTGFRQDCSGFVEASLSRAGAPMRGSTRDLWAALEQQGATHRRPRPAPGDLVFFDDTYDRDGDGRTNDPLTHVGVVLSVDAAGTIVVAHGGTSRGRTTLRMNLLHPHDAADAHGDTINDPLRARRSGDPAGTRYLAAELWRGFATVPPAR